MIDVKLKEIKEVNPEDWHIACIAAHLYIENEKKDNPEEWIKRDMPEVVKDILDKHGINYVDDVCS